MLDQALHALSNRERRRLLVALLDHSPQHDSDLRIPDDVHVPDKDQERLQAEIYHSHLPQLEDAGFIRWDKDDQTVNKGRRFEKIRPFLEFLDEHADKLPDD